jgi:hypothetical protein
MTLSTWLFAAMAAFPAGVSAGLTIEVPSEKAPTISRAFINAKPGDTVVVNNGVYHERILAAIGVVLRARTRFAAIIDGKGRGTVVTMGKNTVIDGFVVRNGTIGIMAKNTGTAVLNCRIVNNWQTGIICVRQLPLIEHNVIAFNRGSGIQGWDVRALGGKISHNTIAYNGNHGIAIGGKSSVVISMNVIAHNERFGVKINPEVESATITENDFFQNLWTPTPLPDRNFTYDPKFAGAKGKMDFSITATSCSGCPQDNQPGARLQSSDGQSMGGEKY